MHRHKLYKWFLTYPQTSITKKSFCVILNKLYLFQFLMICQESHSDGGKHLHSVLVFKDNISKNQILKDLSKHIPDIKKVHIRSVKSLSDSIRYLKKEDKDPIIIGDIPISRILISQYIKLYEKLEFSYDNCICNHMQMSLKRCPVCKVIILNNNIDKIKNNKKNKFF